MAHKPEDFDEFCDPTKPKPVRYEDVVKAVTLINPFIVRTPCLPSHCSRKFAIPLYYKLENLQKSGSFKERGCLNALMRLPLDKQKMGVVVASLGNEGIGMSFHCQRLGIPLFVVMPTSVGLSQQQRCHILGAKVIVQGFNLVESMRYARAVARDKGLTYINGRDHPDVLAGYGTMALEILQDVQNVDAIILPVGTGGLAAAVGTVIKRLKPKCLIYTVQPEATPLFYEIIKNTSEDEPLVVNEPTLANSIAMTRLGTNSFPNIQSFVDKLLLVKEEWIARAIVHMYEKQRLVVEGAGACPLAAIIGHLVPELKLKTVVAIVTGGNINPVLYSRCIDRGLAADGRLVKFNVAIRDNTETLAKLLQILAEGNYNIVQQFQTHRWVEDDEYRFEVSLVCRAKNLEHALELKRIIEKAYRIQYTEFETEPFNDSRVCPCYVYKRSPNY